MKKLLGSFLVAAAILVSYGGGRWLAAYSNGKATKFYSGTGTGDLSVGDLKLNGLDILDNNETTRITIGATNTIVGNVATSGGSFVVFSATAPRTGSVVGAMTIAAGMMFYNSTSGGLCHSTGTVQSSIVASTAPTTACGN